MSSRGSSKKKKKATRGKGRGAKNCPQNRQEPEQEETRASENDDHKSDFVSNLTPMLAELSEGLACKKCKGKLKFVEKNIRGEGLKLLIICENCEPQSIPLTPIDGVDDDVKRGMSFTLRLLQIVLAGMNRFSPVMDYLPMRVFRPLYDKLVNKIEGAVLTINNVLTHRVVREENEINGEDSGVGMGSYRHFIVQ